jgi:hypothetical protein
MRTVVARRRALFLVLALPLAFSLFSQPSDAERSPARGQSGADQEASGR